MRYHWYNETVVLAFYKINSLLNMLHDALSQSTNRHKRDNDRNTIATILLAS